MFYTYVIRSKKDGKWYTGSTNNLRKRFKEHSSNKIFSTKGRGPFELVYYEACVNEQDARMREKYLKSGFGKRYLKNRLKRFLSPTGFTILEVVIALAILSIGLLALLRAIPVGLEASGRAHDTTVALLLAEQKLEEARYSAWPPSDGNDTFGSPNDNFDWARAVTSVAPTTYLREVSISVYWPAAAGDSSDRSKQRCVNVRNYLADYD